ncbi:hypothetical protein Tco_0733663 [Tanacetum coccineum]
MGDENHIRTLGDYSKPNHKGYRNTVELPVGNNVVPLRSDTIRLVKNGCSFHGLRSEDPNQHLKDFLKLVDSLDLDSENRERTRLRLFQFSLRYQASNWLERLPLRDLNAEESWALLEDLALYDNKSWNDPRDFAKPVKAIALPQDVPSTSDRRLIELKNQWSQNVDLLNGEHSSNLTPLNFVSPALMRAVQRLFEVLGCADEFKARLASYKLEGDALSWWKAVKQAKGGETYVATLPWKDFRELFFLQYFSQPPEAARSFLEKRSMYLQEKQAKNFKWALCDWILDGIVNTEFTDVAQVANVARNIEILHERSVQNNKRNRDWDCIRPTTQGNNQRGHDQKRVATIIKGHINRTVVSSTTVLLGLQVKRDTRTMPPLLYVKHVGNFIRASG